MMCKVTLLCISNSWKERRNCIGSENTPLPIQGKETHWKHTQRAMSLLQLILIPCQSSAWACRRSSSNLSSVQDFQLARGSSGALSRTSSCS
eukprot:scaffold74440_cov15-Tisochrysis_lutea.AAC.1